eukprot:12995844-Heterocapsa_arctica.AAC.1
MIFFTSPTACSATPFDWESRSNGLHSGTVAASLYLATALDHALILGSWSVLRISWSGILGCQSTLHTSVGPMK